MRFLKGSNKRKDSANKTKKNFIPDSLLFGTRNSQEETLSKRLKKMVSATPFRLICVSFILVILTGTFVLTLPVSSSSGVSTDFLTALFTATSATCVTGLAIYDTATYWSTFGQVAILVMVQIGGLGIITMTSFFTILIGKKFGFKTMAFAQESTNSQTIDSVRKMLKSILITTGICEAIGAIILMLVFVPAHGAGGFFCAIFTSISAFCNAGMDLLGREGPFVSFTHYNDNPVVLITVALLVIIGGLGFPVWANLIEYRKTKKLTLHSTVVLIGSAVLMVFGMAIFLLLEWNNPETLGELPNGQRFLAAFFQSVMTRTAGFCSVDFSNMQHITKMIVIVFMFIGAAPSSTGGGVKITTVLVILATCWSVMKGKTDTTILKRTIDKETVYKSLTIVMLSVGIVMVTNFCVYFTSLDSLEGIDALFETVSAFSTTGLSTGVMAVASVPAKILIILTMFAGRVGPVSLALSITIKNQFKKKDSILPEGKLFVG